jgi:hypothetical protein
MKFIKIGESFTFYKSEVAADMKIDTSLNNEEGIFWSADNRFSSLASRYSHNNMTSE